MVYLKIDTKLATFIFRVVDNRYRYALASRNRICNASLIFAKLKVGHMDLFAIKNDLFGKTIPIQLDDVSAVLDEKKVSEILFGDT